MKHADMGGNHHGASSSNLLIEKVVRGSGYHARAPGLPDAGSYLHLPVVGWDEECLRAEPPWCGAAGLPGDVMRFPISDFDSAAVVQAKRAVHSGNGSATISIGNGKVSLSVAEPAGKRPQVSRDAYAVYPNSDFHAGDPESVKRAADDLAKSINGLTERAFLYGDLLPTTQEKPPRTVRCVTNWNVGWGDVPNWVRNIPTQNTEEAPGMNLYSVILIDTYNKIVIDTKIVAKNDEAAKLAAGVYRWLLENGRTFDDVTVCVGHLCRVRERMTGSGA